MIDLLLKMLLAYLLGSIVGSLAFGRLFGARDVRNEGSGNAGATNALRTHGVAYGLVVAVFDFAKGWVAVALLAPLALPGVPPASGQLALWVPVVCALAVVIGHVYPVFHGFRGGKGAATLLGAVLSISPSALLFMLLVWLMVVTVIGFVGLATISAAVMLPLILLTTGALPRGPVLVFGLLAAALLVYTHRSNIARMRAGLEPRAQRLWLLGKRPP